MTACVSLPWICTDVHSPELVTSRYCTSTVPPPVTLESSMAGHTTRMRDTTVPSDCLTSSLVPLVMVRAPGGSRYQGTGRLVFSAPPCAEKLASSVKMLAAVSLSVSFSEPSPENSRPSTVNSLLDHP